ncbi:DUF2778 domain-containing protein [uncultured Methylobacterium sp.]|uniref:DUF2778 domain-containing protein n=1 Tax=uncultured Methylobacterium sp. TaxID=157278 RepID=UPI0035CA52EE
MAILAALVSGGVVLGGLTEPQAPPSAESGTVGEPTAAASAGEVAMADASPTLGPEARRHWQDTLRDAFPDWSSERPPAGAEPPTPFARQEPAPTQDAPTADEPARLAQTVPLPVPRPPEFRRPAGPEIVRRAERQAARRTRSAAAPAPAVDDRTFLEKLFNVGAPPAPALAYAALEAPSLDATPRRRLSPVPNPDPARTAVYDISARIVTLPNGVRLEAHSGLGDSMDDPRNVHLRMRGATPPGTYDLTEREDLFHGVRALRLTPAGGSGAVHGRVGLLAHTYMLGPDGASNGCVSFKDYQAFLQAYLSGEVQRLVVVPGGRQDAPPSLAGGNPAVTGRSARLGNDV